MEPTVEINSVSLDYGSVRAVSNLSLAIPAGSLVTLLGPSGCGKTTTLRAIAGLERITDGTITIDKRVVDQPDSRTFIQPNKRNVGMVFQNYGLWPHLTAAENIAYPLKIAGASKAETQARVRELMARMELGKYVDKHPGRLSGGQQQRVAVARALVRRPDVLLFDEPLSNLDARLRRSLRDQIRDIHLQFNATSIYVTHDHEEALAISDYIAVMLDGRLVQYDRPDAIFDSPCSLAIAEFMGFENMLPVSIESRPSYGHAARVTGTDWVVPVPQDVAAATLASPRVKMVFRPDQMHVVAADDPRPLIVGTVHRARYLGDRTEMALVYQGVTIEATVDDWTLHRLGLGIPTPGDALSMVLAADRVRFLPDDGSGTGIEDRVAQ